jgi:site-specific recombinase XerC
MPRGWLGSWKPTYNPGSWTDFRERYESEYVSGLADRTAETICSIFGIVERITNPQKLTDLTASRISAFQAKLREEGKSEATIGVYSRHVKAALRWAVEVGMLQAAPKIRMPKRAKGAKAMKGRPITMEEYERMLMATPKVVGEEAAPSWQYYLEGLWWSGLRLAESLELYWDRQDKLSVDMSGRRPMLRIPANLEKGNQNRLLAMAPEFAEFLERTPPEERKGRVFMLKSPSGRPGWAMRSDICGQG